MEKALTNYKNAMNAHIEARKNCVLATDKLQKTRYAVTLAREELRAVEREIMNDEMKIQ